MTMLRRNKLLELVKLKQFIFSLNCLIYLFFFFGRLTLWMMSFARPVSHYQHKDEKFIGAIPLLCPSFEMFIF
jgi:hypothetical protein